MKHWQGGIAFMVTAGFIVLAMHCYNAPRSNHRHEALTYIYRTPTAQAIGDIYGISAAEAGEPITFFKRNK